MKYRINPKINSSGKVISSCLKTTKQRYMIFYMQHFYKWHQHEIWSKVIEILSIKSSQKKNKYSQSKTCLVKNIIAAKLINYLLMKSSVSPHLLWFFKTPNSLINRGQGMQGWGWRGGGGSHCKWCANDITTYSKNNVIFFYRQTIPISPFVPPPFDIPLFIQWFTSFPL